MPEDTKPQPVQDSVDWEKRFKDTQGEYTKSQQELKKIQEELQETRRALETIQPYVKLPEAQPAEDDYTPVTKAELRKQKDELEKQRSLDNLLLNFRVTYPDMKQYEEIVAVYMQKTDARKPVDVRLDEAVSNARKFIDNERKLGAEKKEQDEKVKKAKEATASGLETVPSVPAPPEQEGQSSQEYVKMREARLRKLRGY